MQKFEQRKGGSICWILDLTHVGMEDETWSSIRQEIRTPFTWALKKNSILSYKDGLQQRSANSVKSQIVSRICMSSFAEHTYSVTTTQLCPCSSKQPQTTYEHMGNKLYLQKHRKPKSVVCQCLGQKKLAHTTGRCQENLSNSVGSLMK